MPVDLKIYDMAQKVLSAGLVRFMGYGDLWGFAVTVLIFYKSRQGFMRMIAPLMYKKNYKKSIMSI